MGLCDSDEEKMGKMVWDLQTRIAQISSIRIDVK